MAPKLYFMDLSPPSRSTLLTARAIGLQLDLVSVNLAVGEHLKPEFTKLNPQHTVPTLDDDGYVLWDSHAINAYLVDKYAKTDSLYPKDLKQRGIVNQRLHFNSGVLQARFSNIIPVLKGGAKAIPEEIVTGLTQAYDTLESLLGDTTYLAGNNITIADLSIAAAISASIPFVPLTKEKHGRVVAWFERVKELPYFNEINEPGAQKLTGFIKAYLA